ncbi:MAG: CRTAC1 family protein [Pirellulales bacterium]
MNKQNRPAVDDEYEEDREQDDAVIGKALLGSAALLAAAVVFGGIIYGIVLFNRKPKEERRTDVVLPTQRDTKAIEKPLIPFTDITKESGITWKHTNGMEGEKLLPETMGGGVAVFDYDKDGDEDLLFVGSSSWPWAKAPVAEPHTLCLYANDGAGHFQDVTAAAGLSESWYAMGPCVGDYDNDGYPDLLVTGVGGSRLYHNEAGKFKNVTAEAGIAGTDKDWTTSAVWFDYDNDSKLDLFVCNYVTWNRDLDLSLGFSLTGIGRAYGQPTTFNGTFSYLFHNEGNGKFKDVSETAGIHIRNENTPVAEGKGLGVAAIDTNHDGWLDLVVANDTVRNYLFQNNKDGTFTEVGQPMGLAYDRNGLATGAMGIDSACFRNTDEMAIAIGNFANEPCSLYVSKGSAAADISFFDSAMTTGLGPATRLNLTFGMFFADLDLDGRQDIVCANGHLEAEINKVQASQTYAQPPQFFWNAGTKGGTELVRLEAAEVGEAALKPMVGRAAAFGDIDGDGDIDVILVANGGEPRVLRNDQQLKHHWLRIRVESDQGNRDAIGAVIQIDSKAGKQTRCVTTTRSYLSQCELPQTFGLGESDTAVDVTITWPGGKAEQRKGLTVDTLHVIKHGQP